MTGQMLNGGGMRFLAGSRGKNLAQLVMLSE